MSHSDKQATPQQVPGSQQEEPLSIQQPEILAPEERELLNEILRALRSMRYGSVVLTVHDGRLVEIQKTERIRRGTSKAKD